MLLTPRLVLRRLTEHDAGALVALNSDPEVVRYAVPEYIDDPPGLQDVRNGPLARILNGYAHDPQEEFWAAMTRPGGEFGGFFFLRPEQGADSWELGYRLQRRLWGQGLATEGAREVLRFGFEDLGVERIVAYVAGPNVGSIRVVEKLGMRHVGSSEWHGYEDRCYERRRA